MTGSRENYNHERRPADDRQISPLETMREAFDAERQAATQRDTTDLFRYVATTLVSRPEIGRVRTAVGGNTYGFISRDMTDRELELAGFTKGMYARARFILTLPLGEEDFPQSLMLEFDKKHEGPYPSDEIIAECERLCIDQMKPDSFVAYKSHVVKTKPTVPGAHPEEYETTDRGILSHFDCFNMHIIIRELEKSAIPPRVIY